MRGGHGEQSEEDPEKETTMARNSGKQANRGSKEGTVDLQKDYASAVGDAGMDRLQEGAAEIDEAREVNAASRMLLAAGVSDLTRAEDVAIVADRLGTLSEVVATAGVMDIAEGADLLEAATDVDIMSAVVGTMTSEVLERGLDLARLSGELQAVGRIVRRMRHPVLADFLSDRGSVLSDMAVANVIRAAGVRSLAAAMAATGEEIGRLSANEVAEGITRLVAADVIRERSEELMERAAESAVIGVAEVIVSEELRGAAADEATEGVAQMLVGAAGVGAAAEADAEAR